MTVSQVLGYRILSCSAAAKDSELKYPIVLLRGLGRSSKFWLGFENEIAKCSEVVMVDLLGTGQSMHPLGRFRVEDHAADVVLTIKSIQKSPCHLVAISFGSMVALKIAETMGTGVISSTLISGSARFTGKPRIQKQALLDLALNLKRPFPQHKTFAKHLVSEAYLRAHPELPELWDAIYRHEGFSRIATLGQLAAAGLFHGKETVANIKSPTFFVASKGDRLVDWQNSLAMSEAAQRPSFYVYEEPGHDIPTEVPGDLAARIADFCFDAETACLHRTA